MDALSGILKKEIVLSKPLTRVLAVAVFVILTSLGASVRIPLPFTPVPITLQTFFVLLSGACLGASLGVTAQVSYIFLGLAGLPIFSGAGSGLLYLAGPTAGYLVGFVIAALFTGVCLKGERHHAIYVWTVLFLADAILLACGIVWLKVLLGYSWGKLLLIGVLPFVPGDIIKVSLAALCYMKLRLRCREIVV